EVAANPEGNEESATLEAQAGENTVRETLSVASTNLHLLAPARIAGTPAAAVRFRVSAPGAASITATGLPSGSAFDTNAGAFEWTPAASALGEHAISFVAMDLRGAQSRTSVAVYVGTGAPVVTQL